MSLRIAFNGREYDGVESMPSDVRKTYEAALTALGGDDREKMESALGHASSIKVNVNVRRRIKINGKDYDSVEAMPADVRAIYERALASNPKLAEIGPGSSAGAPAGMPSMPPALDEDDSPWPRILRLAFVAAAGAALLAWFLLRH